MVSESELISHLRSFLQSSDLTVTTTATVRRKLEGDFGIDLSDKKGFIREQVDFFLQSQNEEEKFVKEEIVEEEEDFGGGNVGGFVGEEEEEEGLGSKRKRTKKKKKKKDTSEEGTEDVKKKGGGGFMKACTLSPPLQKLLGVSESPRTEVVKQIWAYIREKNLQDPNNRREILCDEALRSLFHVDSINMFQMTKVLSDHIWPLGSEEAPENLSHKEKACKQERNEDEGDLKPKEKRRKTGGGAGFLAPLQLSDALVKFFDNEETVLKRSEVVKKMWEYIKQNNLQDPSDRKTILCDDKFRELFKVDSFVGFTITKHLAGHMTKLQR